MPSTRCYASRIDWARQVCGRISRSLDELARYLNSQTDLGDIKIICANVTSAVREQKWQISRIMRHYGFETIDDPQPLPLRERFGQFAENILISLMVFAQNADTLRRDTLRRVRVPIYVSRRDCSAGWKAHKQPSLWWKECTAAHSVAALAGIQPPRLAALKNPGYIVALVATFLGWRSCLSGWRQAETRL